MRSSIGCSVGLLRSLRSFLRGMEQPDLPTEIRLTNPPGSLGQLYLDWMPQPGACLEVAGQYYRVLERRHRYQLKTGRYHLHKISLYVQPAERPTERSLVDGIWILGDGSCKFNAHSELVRCAVNPAGPCQGCQSFETE
jgi:hypothetical protein